MNTPLIRSLTVSVSPAIENQNSKIENTLDFISSDETLDRYSEIISARGWKLDSYLKNPVFQNSHQYGDIIHTLGRALITEVRTETPKNGNTETPFLFQRIEFAVEANPIARIAHSLYRGGFLRAVSVGFRPLRWVDGNDERSLATTFDDDLQPQSKFENRKSKFSRKYLEQELLEVSAVAIPANTNALALAYKSGALEKSDLMDAASAINAILRSGPQPSESAAAGQSKFENRNSKIPEILQLARALRSILGRS